jgi:hypothetical protein
MLCRFDLKGWVENAAAMESLECPVLLLRHFAKLLHGALRDWVLERWILSDEFV